MSRPTYEEQRLDPRWQRKRLEVMDAAGWACERCGDTRLTLHVHHPFYRSGAMVWEYDREELECLCANCHTGHHGHGRPPAGSLSAKRSAWETLLVYHLAACATAADTGGEWPYSRQRATARQFCIADGLDFDALEASLLG